jgi:uncharacterized protein YndB with AHSA1/START domain
MPLAEEKASEPGLKLSITRLFDAAPERVFDAWLSGDQIARWLGPRSMVSGAETLLLEPRVGGRFRIRMEMPATATRAANPTVTGIYREIVRPSRLVFTWTWEDEGHETLVTVTFKPVGKQTELTLLHENFASVERRDGHNRGWTESLEQLARMLAEHGG